LVSNLKIHLLGPSGSGTSTIGKTLSEKFNLPFFDSDDFFWEDTTIPYSQKREIHQREHLLKSMIETHDSWVVSGSALKWGDILLEKSDLIVLVYCDKDTRLERLKLREEKKFGDRIKPGNDMYENHIAFINWAMEYDTGGLNMRSKKSEELWVSMANCKVLSITNTDLNHAVKEVLDFYSTYLPGLTESAGN